MSDIRTVYTTAPKELDNEKTIELCSEFGIEVSSGLTIRKVCMKSGIPREDQTDRYDMAFFLRFYGYQVKYRIKDGSIEVEEKHLPFE